MAAVGIDRQIAAELQRATFDKAPRLAARAKAASKPNSTVGLKLS